MSIEAIAYVLSLPADRCRLGARLAAIAIANHADEKGEAWPSIGTIARLAGLNNQTAKRAVIELCKEGILERVIGGAPDGRIPANKRPNLYRFLEFPTTVSTNPQGGTETTPQEVWGGTKNPLGGYGNARQGGTETTPKPSYNHHEPRAKLSTGEAWRSNQAGVTADDVLDRMASNGVVADFGEDSELTEGASSLAQIREQLS